MYNFTPEDLLRYLYKEMSLEETVSIEAELVKSWPLREKLEVLKAARERLNTLLEVPRNQAVLNILKYAADQHRVNS